MKVTSDLRRSNYKRLRDVGFSREFARNHDRLQPASIDKLIQKKPAGVKLEKFNKVYKKLRAKGYSRDIARRYYHANKETIKLLLKRLIPNQEINNIIKQHVKRLYDERVKLLVRSGYSLSQARMLAHSHNDKEVKKLVKAKRKSAKKAARKKVNIERRKKYDLLRRANVPPLVASKISGRSWDNVYSYIRRRGKRRKINWVERRFMDKVGAKSRKELYGKGKWAKRFARLLYNLESNDNSPEGKKARELIWLKVRRPDAEYGVGDTPTFERVVIEA